MTTPTRELLHKILYALTFLSLLGHGGPGSCDDVVRNASKLPGAFKGGPGSGKSCNRSSRTLHSDGGCYSGDMLESSSSECGEAELTLPDGRILKGTHSDGVSTFENERGTCWLSPNDYLMVCWGDAGTCESDLRPDFFFDAGAGTGPLDGGVDSDADVNDARADASD